MVNLEVLSLVEVAILQTSTPVKCLEVLEVNQGRHRKQVVGIRSISHHSQYLEVVGAEQTSRSLAVKFLVHCNHLVECLEQHSLHNQQGDYLGIQWLNQVGYLEAVAAVQDRCS
jgi:hypothetical protein